MKATRSRHRLLSSAMRSTLFSCIALAGENALAQQAVVALSDLDGSSGFALIGVSEGDYSGYSVSAAGDIDGDGFDDVIVGAARTDINGYYSGSSYLVFGHAPQFSDSLDLADLDGHDGSRLDGPRIYMEAGRSVSGAGDVNGDGFDDLVIGAPFDYASGSYSGSSYVVFGHARPFPAAMDLDAVDGQTGFRVGGASSDTSSGFSVAGAGDVNGDGFDDILIGAPFASVTAGQSGSSYVVFGHAGDFPARMSLNALDGDDGFRLDGVAAYDNSGRTVAAAGDINDDGIDDLVIGANRSSAGARYAGSSYVVFGHAGSSAPALNLADLDGTSGVRIDGAAPNDNSGFSVSGAGDVNADGVDDLIIGSDNAGPNGPASGSAHVVFGHAGDFPAMLALAALDGATGFRMDGSQAGDFAGNRVAGAGDVNGDGAADILVGSPGSRPHGERSGSSHVVFGHPGAFSATFALADIDGTNGYRLDGAAAFDASGAALSRAGDFNGDGIDDFMIGAFGSDTGVTDAGAIYLLFGAASGTLFCDGFDGGPCLPSR